MKYFTVKRACALTHIHTYTHGKKAPTKWRSEPSRYTLLKLPAIEGQPAFPTAKLPGKIYNAVKDGLCTTSRLSCQEALTKACILLDIFIWIFQKKCITRWQVWFEFVTFLFPIPAAICQTSPDAPKNSFITGNSTAFYGQHVTYTCEDGHILSSEKGNRKTQTVNCTEDGTFERKELIACRGKSLFCWLPERVALS